MEDALQEISVIPGVMGSCVFDKNKGLVGKEPGTDLEDSFLETAGVRILRLLKMSRQNNLGINAAHFRYDKLMVIGMPVKNDAALLTICDSQANASLVTTTSAMLIRDIKETLKSDNVAAPPQTPQKTAVPTQNKPPADNPNAEKLDRVLDDIESALARVAGPVAGMILQDHLEKWRRNGPEEFGRINELIHALKSEIHDSRAADAFADEARRLI